MTQPLRLPLGLRAARQVFARAIIAPGPKVPVFPQIDASLSAGLFHHIGKHGNVFTAAVSGRSAACRTAGVKVIL